MANQSVTPLDNQKFDVKKAVPVILFLFVFCLIIDNSFKLISVDMANDLGISATTVSWQATLAGLIIGIGAVVYASLADTISIRTLLAVGIVFICIGSLMGYIFKESFALILISRIIQTAGLASAETLYIIFVAKHLPKDEQKKFLGFSTSSYSLSLVIGSLTGGFVSTYLHWTTLFLIPLLTILILPLILKYLPKESSQKGYVDVIGLFLIATIATSVMLYITDFNWLYFVVILASAALFILYISKGSKPLIGIEFFKNKRFVSLLAVAFIIYTVQLGYIFLFPFLLEAVYGLRLDTVSLLLIPGYITAVIIGALSGKIANRLSSKQTIILAMLFIAISLFLPGLFIDSSYIVFVLSMMLFSGSFALMYAPLIDSCIGTIPREKSGTAIGFYNLVINVAASIGIAYTASLIDNNALQKGFIGFTNNAVSAHYSNVLLILSAVGVFALFLYWLLTRRFPESN